MKMAYSKIPVPFPMPPVFSQDKRHRYMLSALQHKFPQIRRYAPIGNEVLSIVGYGPSLIDTWQDIRRPILTMSGAHNFLIERGIVPDFHADMDPRPHKLQFITPPHKDVNYLMATVCNPWTWEVLKEFKVTLWHAVSGDDTKRFITKWDPGTMMISGGSCMGLVSFHLAGVLGYNRFEVFGMDGSWKDGKRHAGFHGGFPHGEIEWDCFGRKFLSSRIMMNSNIELQYFLTNFPVFCVFHGDGFNQHWIANNDIPTVAVAGTDKAKFVRRSRYINLTSEQFEEFKKSMGTEPPMLTDDLSRLKIA
jgi:hypothetical protein